MRLNEESLENIEEFLSSIPGVDEDDGLLSAVEGVRVLCGEDLFELTSVDLDELAFEILRGLEEVWDLLPEEQKDSDLQSCYEDLMKDLEDESADDDFQSEDEEYEDNFEEYSEDDGECEEDEWI